MVGRTRSKVQLACLATQSYRSDHGWPLSTGSSASSSGGEKLRLDHGYSGTAPTVWSTRRYLSSSLPANTSLRPPTDAWVCARDGAAARIVRNRTERATRWLTI